MIIVQEVKIGFYLKISRNRKKIIFKGARSKVTGSWIDVDLLFRKRKKNTFCMSQERATIHLVSEISSEAEMYLEILWMSILFKSLQ
ncbi:MAG: hypothetical protein ACI86M_001840 [Saprospiraceae bacterium]|jgi:hypothetical protein